MLTDESEIRIKAIRGDIFLPDLKLWLDPKKSKPNAYISHGHADHVSRSEKIICSSETAHIINKRFGIKSASINSIKMRETLRVDNYDLKVMPAGHIVGSSMLLIKNRKNGSTLLYTGDFKVDSSRTCEAASPCHADVLIMETTFGHPKYEFPKRADTEESLITFVRNAINDNKIPIIYCYSLGKSQEVSSLLGENDIPLVAHKSTMQMNEACRELGVNLPESNELNKTSQLQGSAVICPPSASKLQYLNKLENKTTAMISGWGIDDNSRYRYKVDKVFPLSDHADYKQLINFVHTVNPSTVYTVHGFTNRFAADLRREGRTAWSLFKSDQLELFDKQTSKP